MEKIVGFYTDADGKKRPITAKAGRGRGSKPTRLAAPKDYYVVLEKKRKLIGHEYSEGEGAEGWGHAQKEPIYEVTGYGKKLVTSDWNKAAELAKTNSKYVIGEVRASNLQQAMKEIKKSYPARIPGTGKKLTDNVGYL